MANPTYGFIQELETTDFGQAVEKVKERLQSEGFGVLTSIDIQAAMKEKLDLDFRPYTILGACNPPLAHKALETEDHIGLLLPCNIVVQQKEKGEIIVSIADPKAMFALVDNKALQPVAEEAEERLRKVLASLS